MALLDITDVTVERERLPVVHGVSLDVDAGQVTVLLGVNGAGKTSLLEAVSGVVPLAGGTVSLAGARIDRIAPYRRVRAGLVHIEEGRSVFPDLTTQENLLIATGGGSTEDAYTMFPELDARRKVAAGLLSGGEQQMLAVGRALLLRPKALIIDELSLGLAPLLVARLMKAVAELARSGVAVLLVEQFARLALQIGERAYVLRGGRVVYDGSCAELAGTEGLLHSLYLGEDLAHTPEAGR
ncbi:ABC transporter ATP-binding protein [Catenulispora yoronensis]|uniref:ABC transporter ATP-binding protein n=1 Tax=Catenulispora yoronensis TaxID=450799 RepID=A0ABN2V320_9ACTN